MSEFMFDWWWIPIMWVFGFMVGYTAGHTVGSIQGAREERRRNKDE